MRVERDRDRRYAERRERFRERLRDLRQRIREGEAETVTEEDIRELGNMEDLRLRQRTPWDLASNTFCLFFASLFPDQNHHTV